MKRTLITCAVLALPLVLAGDAGADDPFAGGADALAVADSDGSSSLRAKIKLKKMMPDMVMVQVKSVNDAKFPDCVFSARVLKDSQSKDRHLKLIGRGKTYRFAPVLKKRGAQVVLADKMTQNNLGACYYPPRTKLVVKVGGVDLKTKVFQAQEIYVK